MARFGSFELDSVRRRITRAGETVHLTPKAYALLTVLIDAAPRVVPKAELHQRLWPNGIVSDASLSGLVKELRRAFARSESPTSFIRTVHRVGYAFDAPMVAGDERSRTGAACWLAAWDRTLPLTQGENLVGRDQLCTVRLDHSTVSRRHALIVVGSGGTLVEDLGSKNGTSVDGGELSGRASLRDGSRVAFGQVLLTYRETSVGMPTVTQVGRIGAAVPEN